MCIWNVPIHRICESFSWKELALRYHSSVGGLQEDQVSWKGDKVIWGDFFWWQCYKIRCHLWHFFHDNVSLWGVTCDISLMTMSQNEVSQIRVLCYAEYFTFWGVARKMKLWISHVTNPCDKIMKWGHMIVVTCDTHHL